ncbi:hypothetical protein Tco_1511539 [Tanacetum coccineum]
MKDLGEATFILGIKIYRDRSKRLIGLSQSAYMDKILKRYRMDNSKRKLNFELSAITMLDLRLIEMIQNLRQDMFYSINQNSKGFSVLRFFCLNGGAVDWKSSKQSTTAMSATEAEYIAALEAAMEAV